ncbi:hypothetical protein L9F63_019185 [Diploptera punctata]|uniref:Uncharacterized protein n=1 Tax=Diploptera punctata TaxID=6984 RepID=A0AAD8EEV4_DIPPU|nr:hypothetical protein L9F63_019185 [Diploptera punctata]
MIAQIFCLAFFLQAIAFCAAEAHSTHPSQSQLLFGYPLGVGGVYPSVGLGYGGYGLGYGLGLGGYGVGLGGYGLGYGVI